MAIIRQQLRQSWHVWIPAAASLLLAVGILFPLPETRPFTSDAAIYHYGGLLLAKGYTPYLHMWDIKPPLIFLTTAAIALVAPGDGMIQVYLGQVLVAIYTTIAVAAVAAIVRRRRDSRHAALAAGLSVLTYPQFFTPMSTGIRAAHGAIAFAAVSLWAMETDRFRLAIGTATVAAGYWPVAVIAPIIVLGEARRHGKRLLSLLGILGGVTAICVAPIAARGAFIPMVNEVLFGPIIKGETGGPLSHFRKLFRVANRTIFLWIVGGIGALHYVDVAVEQREILDGWWLPFGGAFAVMWVLFLDFDGSVDLYLLCLFAALGLGVAVADLTRRQQRAAIVVVLVVLSAIWIPANGWITDTRTGAPGDSDYHDHLMEQRVPPESCHMRIGFGEREWMRITGETENSHRCGLINPISLAWRVVS